MTLITRFLSGAFLTFFQDSVFLLFHISWIILVQEMLLN